MQQRNRRMQKWHAVMKAQPVAVEETRATSARGDHAGYPKCSGSMTAHLRHHHFIMEAEEFKSVKLLLKSEVLPN